MSLLPCLIKICWSSLFHSRLVDQRLCVNIIQNYAESMPRVYEISVRKNYSFSVSTVSIQNYFENLSYVSSKMCVNALRKSLHMNSYGAD